MRTFKVGTVQVIQADTPERAVFEVGLGIPGEVEVTECSVSEVVKVEGIGWVEFMCEHGGEDLSP